MRIAFDISRMKVGCALLQASMGGLNNEKLITHFPTDTWLLAPTPELKVYEITEAQLKQLSDKLKMEHKTNRPAERLP